MNYNLLFNKVFLILLIKVIVVVLVITYQLQISSKFSLERSFENDYDQLRKCGDEKKLGSIFFFFKFCLQNLKLSAF